MDCPHIPVLLEEITNTFRDIDSGIIIDCTLGYGGHSKAILDTNPNIKIIACDRDQTAINFCKTKFKDYQNRIEIKKNEFSKILNQINQDEVVGVLADIGVSSLQLDYDERGFGLNSNTLDMRMDKNSPFSAKELVNSYSLDELARIFKEYGELNNAKNLAQKIINARNQKEISSAKELCEILGSKNVPGRKVNQLILAFQAIRIEVNKELDELKNLLDSIENSKIKKAVIAIISFHSLEDKIVKSYFKKWSKSCICPPEAFRCTCQNNHSIGKIITKKPITASKDELVKNSRSSCAKLRVFQLERD